MTNLLVTVLWLVFQAREIACSLLYVYTYIGYISLAPLYERIRQRAHKRETSSFRFPSRPLLVSFAAFVLVLMYNLYIAGTWDFLTRFYFDRF